MTTATRTWGDERAWVHEAMDPEDGCWCPNCRVAGWGWLYIATDGTLTKVGYTGRDADKRVRELANARVCDVRLTDVIDAVTRGYEALVHQRLAEHRVHGEWYSITPRQALATAITVLKEWEATT